MQPKISIVIVAYNGENYLRQALSAACSQTYKNYEIVLIDDGSTDTTLQIAESILNFSTIEHKIIHLIKNKGLAHGRTTGISNSSGDWLIFNDQDDYMANNCLEVLAQYALSGYDKIYSNIIYIDKNGSEINRTYYSDKTDKWVIPHLQGVLIKKSLFVDNKIDFPSEIHIDDVTASGKINMFSKKPIGISEQLYYMRIHEKSMTHSKKWAPTRTKYLNDMLTNLTQFAARMNYRDNDRCFEYYCMRYYYSVVMNCRTEPLKGKRRQYKELMTVIPKYFPDYLNNPIVHRSCQPSYDSFHKRIQLLVKAERFDRLTNGVVFMNSILLGYHIFDRIGIYKHE